MDPIKQLREYVEFNTNYSRFDELAEEAINMVEKDVEIANAIRWAIENDVPWVTSDNDCFNVPVQEDDLKNLLKMYRRSLEEN